MLIIISIYKTQLNFNTFNKSLKKPNFIHNNLQFYSGLSYHYLGLQSLVPVTASPAPPMVTVSSGWAPELVHTRHSCWPGLHCQPLHRASCWQWRAHCCQVVIPCRYLEPTQPCSTELYSGHPSSFSFVAAASPAGRADAGGNA